MNGERRANGTDGSRDPGDGWARARVFSSGCGLDYVSRHFMDQALQLARLDRPVVKRGDSRDENRAQKLAQVHVWIDQFVDVGE